jgi:glycosyltransferase involved in cell wall biosynthesis
MSTPENQKTRSPRKIGVLQLSAADFGGAGMASAKLHENLIDNGFNSVLVVQHKKSDDSGIFEFRPSVFYKVFNKLCKLIERLLGRFDDKFIFYDRGRSSLNSVFALDRKLEFSPDIIVLGLISGFVDLSYVERLKDKYSAEICWHIFDMAPFTGGCHFSWGCEKFQIDCDDCPGVGGLYSKFPPSNLARKTAYVKSMNVMGLFTVPWMESRLRSSAVFQNSRLRFLTTGTDERVFRAGGKGELRCKYNIPIDRKVLFFGALDTTDPRKGFDYLVEALIHYESKYGADNLLLISAGKVGVALRDWELKIEHLHVGFLNGYARLRDVYALADVFVSPVVEDIGPAMVNESLLCGLPVVAFDVGIARDVVRTGSTGFLASKGNVKELSDGIYSIVSLESGDYETMSKNCINIVAEKFTREQQLVQFHRLVAVLLKSAN